MLSPSLPQQITLVKTKCIKRAIRNTTYDYKYVQPGTCHQHEPIYSLQHKALHSIKSKGETDKSTVVGFNLFFRDKSLSQHKNETTDDMSNTMTNILIT